MWRVLIQLPSLLVACADQLRTISYLLQQSLLLQQETNGLLRELIVKVTTQAVETPAAVTLPMPTSVLPASTAASAAAPQVRKRRVLTDRDIVRNTRVTIAADQMQAAALREHPHRQGEILPSPPPPIGGLP